MAARTRTAPGTEEHRAPEPFGTEDFEPALLVAFPMPVVLPLPPSGAPVGREWLAGHGVEDTRVSTAHLLFTRAAGTLFVEDVGSRNGTWVDGERLRPNDRAKLSDGAVIRVGRKVLVYREELRGTRVPAPPIGQLVGPFGLRGVADSLAGIQRRPPRCVLIEGETGTGKELVASVLSELLRPGKPFMAANVAGIASGVFESQLFGHIAGAFSGSGKGSRGIITSHDGGTVFLDEIGELPLDLQPKLLRLLENGEVLAVGADRPARVDVLILAATNRDLEQMVEAGGFRRDLLARFAATVEIPPLRERTEDLFAIITARAARTGDRYDIDRVEIEAIERLMLHPWQANVRELSAVLDRIAAIDPPPGLRFAAVTQVLGATPSQRGGVLTRERVEAALAACAGNQSRAARQLGVSRGQLLRFLKP